MENSSSNKQIKDFFFSPNGGGPKWENFGLIAALAAGFGYYIFNLQTQSEEITYMDFINNYLANKKAIMITISEDKKSDMFKFRAQIDLDDGRRVHLVLP